MFRKMFGAKPPRFWKPRRFFKGPNPQFWKPRRFFKGPNLGGFGNLRGFSKGQTSEVLETSEVFHGAKPRRFWKPPRFFKGPNLGGFGNLRGFSWCQTSEVLETSEVFQRAKPRRFWKPPRFFKGPNLRGSLDGVCNPVRNVLFISLQLTRIYYKILNIITLDKDI